MARSVLSYATEARINTKKTKQQVRMTILRKIPNVTLRDRWKGYGVQDLLKWSKRRRKEWNDHVERMETNRLVFIYRQENLSKEATEATALEIGAKLILFIHRIKIKVWYAGNKLAGDKEEEE